MYPFSDKQQQDLVNGVRQQMLMDQLLSDDDSSNSNTDADSDFNSGVDYVNPFGVVTKPASLKAKIIGLIVLLMAVSVGSFVAMYPADSSNSVASENNDDSSYSEEYNPGSHDDGGIYMPPKTDSDSASSQPANPDAIQPKDRHANDEQQNAASGFADNATAGALQSTEPTWDDWDGDGYTDACSQWYNSSVKSKSSYKSCVASRPDVY